MKNESPMLRIADEVANFRVADHTSTTSATAAAPSPAALDKLHNEIVLVHFV